MKAAKKNTKFNPYIIPLMLIMGLLPLIVHLKEYKTHLEEYAFFAAPEYYDIFLYYKAAIFIIICSVMVVLIIVQAIRDHKVLKWKMLFIPLALYALLALLSAIFSETPYFSFNGIYEHFESVWVLLGYTITVYYGFIFVKSEKDIDLIMYALTAGTFIMLLIGLSQAFSVDFFRSDLGRYVILPSEYWKDETAVITFQFPLGRVYLTLYNPNYVGSYVSLISPLFLTYAIAKKKLVLAVVNTVMYVGLLLCILGSGSKAGFLGVAFSLLLLFIFLLISFNKKLLKFLPEFLIVVILIIGTVYTYNNYSNDQLSSAVKRAFDIEQIDHDLTSIETNDQNIVIHYKGHELKLSFFQRLNYETGEFSILFKDENDEKVNFVSYVGEEELSYYRYNTEDERFSGITVGYGMKDDKRYEFITEMPPLLTVRIDGKDWDFIEIEVEENFWSYYYINPYYYAVKMRNAEYVESLDKYSRAFSGRGFIWSRTLPLIKDNILLGTGPDTFLLNFPNEDYVAMYNGGYDGEHMTKPHNMFLQIAVQTGLISLICFLVFYFWYFGSSFRLYSKVGKNSPLAMIGIGILCGTFGYMIVAIINDSMVVIAPIFWTMIGIGLAINTILKKEVSFAVIDNIEEKETENVTETEAETVNEAASETVKGNETKNTNKNGKVNRKGKKNT